MKCEEVKNEKSSFQLSERKQSSKTNYSIKSKELSVEEISDSKTIFFPFSLNKDKLKENENFSATNKKEIKIEKISEFNSDSKKISNEANFYSPLCSYFAETENYFKKKYPKNTEYKVSKNYLEKEIFFSEKKKNKENYNPNEKKDTKNQNQKKISKNLFSTNFNENSLIDSNNNYSYNYSFPVYYIGYYNIDIEQFMNNFLPLYSNNQNNNNNTKNNKQKYKPNQKKNNIRNDDWICKNCQNINFSFRLVCNRCKKDKKDVEDLDSKKEIEKYKKYFNDKSIQKFKKNEINKNKNIV